MGCNTSSPPSVSHCSTLPDDVDTPLRWLVDGANEEFRLLEGTMVGLLSRMMHSQVCNSLQTQVAFCNLFCTLDSSALDCSSIFSEASDRR